MIQGTSQFIVFNAGDLDSQHPELGSGLLVDFPPSSPNECPLIDAEMLTETGNVKAGNSVHPEYWKH